MTVKIIAPIASEMMNATGQNRTSRIVSAPRLKRPIAAIGVEVSLASLLERPPAVFMGEHAGYDDPGVNADQNGNESVSDHRNCSIE
jgi:hypothetical protein